MNKNKFNKGLKNLFSKTVSVIGTAFLALTGSKLIASEVNNINFMPDDDNHIESFKIKAKPQLLLKLNTSSPNLYRGVMHTSHSSHRSHSSHMSHSSGGHYSHASHTSHVSSTYSPAPTHSNHSSHFSSSSTPSYTPSYTPTFPSSNDTYTPTTPDFNSYTPPSIDYNTYKTTTYELGERSMSLLDEGKDIRILQALLKLLGYDVNVTGTFDLSTQSAVKQFQRKHLLVADGIVGSKTLQKIINLSAPLLKD